MIDTYLSSANSKLNNDPVLQFRLKNGVIYSFIVMLLLPILTKLNGLELSLTVITIFATIKILVPKFNNYIVHNYNLSQVFKVGIFVNILFMLTLYLYFFSEHVFVVTMNIVMIFELLIFSSYSILLDEHLVENNPKQLKVFKSIRNSAYSDAGLLAMGVAMIFEFNAIYVLVVSAVLYSFYLIKNYNFFDHN